MIHWLDIVSIVFVCVTANHLSLVQTIEKILNLELLIINCPRCFTFWSVLAYELWSVGFSDIPLTLAISFLCSYIALWLELFEGFLDFLFSRIYEKIYPDSGNDAATSVGNKDNTDCTVSQL